MAFKINDTVVVSNSGLIKHSSIANLPVMCYVGNIPANNNPIYFNMVFQTSNILRFNG